MTPDEVIAKGDPFGVRPRVEMKLLGAIVQDAIAGSVGVRGPKLGDASRRLAPHELHTELEHEIDSSIIHRHEKRIAISAVMNHSNLHGRVLYE